jgi:ABC-type nitrate/sulfonate/bicarbonate transport system substrate-binding protein
MRKILLHCAAAVVALAIMDAGSGTVNAAEPAHPLTIRFFMNHGYVDSTELADALGWLKPLGIKMESVGYSQGGPENLFGLNNGSVDIAGAATPALINAIAGGAPIIGVMPNVGESKTVSSKFFVLADGPINNAEDLKGQSIAVNTLGAHLDHVVREYLKQHDMQLSDVQLVVVPGPQLDQVLRHKQVGVAAVGAWQTVFSGRMEQEGGVRPLFTAYDVLGEIALSSNIMRKSFVEQHPQAVRDLVSTAAKAVDWTHDHPDEARSLVAKMFKERGDNPEVAQYFLGSGVRRHALYTDRDAQFWIDALVNAGRIKTGQFAPADIETNKYNDLANLTQR